METLKDTEVICEAALRYRADITAGSLKVAESRVIADLLLKQADDVATEVVCYLKKHDENSVLRCIESHSTSMSCKWQNCRGRSNGKTGPLSN